RDWVVHCAFRDDVHVAGVEFDLFILELNKQPSTHDQEQFVFILVVVPCQLAFDFCDLHVLVVDTADHFRRPVVGNLVKTLLKVNFHHPCSYSFRSAVVGSNPAARRAGRNEASTAITRNSTATETNVSGSVGLTSTSMLAMMRVITNAPTRPIAIPITLR